MYGISLVSHHALRAFGVVVPASSKRSSCGMFASEANHLGLLAFDGMVQADTFSFIGDLSIFQTSTLWLVQIMTMYMISPCHSFSDSNIVFLQFA